MGVMEFRELLELGIWFGCSAQVHGSEGRVSQGVRGLR